MPRVVLAPDKFRGTADAATVAAAMAEAAGRLGWEVTSVPLSDGGEGLLDACAAAFPGVASTTVTGPDGRPGGGRVAVRRRHGGGRVGPGFGARRWPVAPARNDPVAATSRGTGELLVAAARRVGPGGTVVVGLGGSATTDGGLGAVQAVEEAGGTRRTSPWWRRATST